MDAQDVDAPPLPGLPQDPAHDPSPRRRPLPSPARKHRSWQGCDLDLTGATIDGPMDFSGAVFSGAEVSFEGAAFTGGRVDLDVVTFSGGALDFNLATGAVPNGLLDVRGRPLYPYAALPPAWLATNP
ncbi:pentapeptide repeat-containing protein [Streptomyces sp. NPDC058294]|uniref:pentapeptide repeat-containing protein n=1 Tax=Streptomyces sp. NPDC058294 TaxID=3346430 RepID=UPI0036EACD72